MFNHMKIQQLQQNLEQAQQQENHFKAQMEVSLVFFVCDCFYKSCCGGPALRTGREKSSRRHQYHHETTSRLPSVISVVLLLSYFYKSCCGGPAHRTRREKSSRRHQHHHETTSRLLSVISVQDQQKQLRAQLQQLQQQQQQRQMTPQQQQQQANSVSQQQVAANQQRMMRPAISNNPGLRHLLQQVSFDILRQERVDPSSNQGYRLLQLGCSLYPGQVVSRFAMAELLVINSVWLFPFLQL
ncbi:hypothetical protein J6590_068292 [Homalodisca vitripennis]|nr:hypothetical protein J6590_068292 [Homalodisca vitripennis]